MYTTWPNLPSLIASRWPLGGRTERSQGGGCGRGAGTGGGREHGVLIYRDRKHSAGRINIGREIDEGGVQTTDDRAPGSGRAKLGREITTEWS